MQTLLCLAQLPLLCMPMQSGLNSRVFKVRHTDFLPGHQCVAADVQPADMSSLYGFDLRLLLFMLDLKMTHSRRQSCCTTSCCTRGVAVAVRAIRGTLGYLHCSTADCTQCKVYLQRTAACCAQCDTVELAHWCQGSCLCGASSALLAACVMRTGWLTDADQMPQDRKASREGTLSHGNAC